MFAGTEPRSNQPGLRAKNWSRYSVAMIWVGQ